MTHTATIASVRGFAHTYQPVPREGTRTRALYDLFKQHSGEIVKLDQVARMQLGIPLRSLPRMIEYLQSTYGLDIRRLKYKHYCLVGEWQGSQYIDYLALRMKA